MTGPSHEERSTPLLRIEIYGPPGVVAAVGTAGSTEDEGQLSTTKPADIAEPPAAPKEPRSPRAASRPRPSSRARPASRRKPASRPKAAPTSDLADDLAQREAEVVRREQALTGSEGLLDAGVADIKRREGKLRELESALHERLRELDDREVGIDRREIELEAAFGIREDRVETREAELAELADRLHRKEEDLARYVGQVQAQLAQRG